MIYLASPYTISCPKVRKIRFELVCRYAAKLMASGLHVHSPIAHTHPIAEAGELPKGWDYWETQDRWYVERCDEVWVLMLPGWEESKGIAAEVEIAIALGKPVKYVSPDSASRNGGEVVG